MPKPPHIPDTAPFSIQQRAWLNGWLAGLFSGDDDAQGANRDATPQPALEPLLVMYGSQSGTAESLAKEFSKAAAAHGFEPRTLELNNYASVELAKEKRLAIITSTWGEGDPPDNAVEFWNFIRSEDAPRLDQLSYSLLALGDSNYEEFCGAGRRFDDRLSELGAKRIYDRVECDVDYEEPAQEWMTSVWTEFKKTTNGANGSQESSIVSEPDAKSGSDNGNGNGAKLEIFSRKNPFPAKLTVNRVLNAEGSAKETRHFEISLAGSGLSYEVGDALGVWPTNCPDAVEHTAKALGHPLDSSVTREDGDAETLRDALTHRCDISTPPRSFLVEVSRRTTDNALAELLQTANKARLNEYLEGRDIADVLHDYPDAKFRPQEFVGLLRKLSPRLYSISSSLKAHPNEVHLTVGAVRYEAHGRTRKGVCSTFLSDRVSETDTIPVYVQPSHGFKPPTDGDTPMIMVGPGTGIAPFRAFLEERSATKAQGGNWLFFGDQRAATDFLYRDELEAWRDQELLTRFDTAFSRDQTEKIYVQDRMRENAEELWKWLQKGAHFYVCGDAKRMAKDVDAALQSVIASAGGLSAEEASDYVKQLKKEKRYQRDVY